MHHVDAADGAVMDGLVCCPVSLQDQECLPQLWGELVAESKQLSPSLRLAGVQLKMDACMRLHGGNGHPYR